MSITMNFLSITLTCLLAIGALVGQSTAATIETASPSYSDVKAAISDAESGDTVIVHDGDATWSSTLKITKGITLQGGEGTITSNVGSGWLIQYYPSSPSLDEPFRITGFHIDFDNDPNGINLYLSSNSYPVTNIRIDNNHFENTKIAFFKTNGPFFGVMDSNTITGAVHLDMYWKNSCSDWSKAKAYPSTHGAKFGSDLNFYIEDNVIYSRTVAASGGHGGRYVFRYNTYNWTNPSGGVFPWFDMHGNQNTVVGTQMIEIYGNEFKGSITGLKAFDIRGGESLIFFNKAKNRSKPTAYYRNEYADSLQCNGDYTQHVNNSYNWNNRGSGEALIEFAEGGDGPGEIAKNAQYWNHNPSYNGTTQIGSYCGSSLPSKCNTGDSAWITDQNCSNVDDGQLGANPSNPIDGTLYKCTSTNTWSEYYTPFMYPHPLRTGQVVNQDPPNNPDPVQKVRNLRVVDSGSN